MQKIKLAVIITAGGNSTRYGKNKLIEKIDGKEVIIHSIQAFMPLNPSQIIVSVSETFEPVITNLLQKYGLKQVKVVRGGAARQDSVFNALKMCSDVEYAAIHDAARPLILLKDIEKCLEKALASKAAIVGVKAVDTIKIVKENNEIADTPDRNTLWCVQTPQIFDYKLILEAHKKLEGKNFSDDAGLLEYLGEKVYITEGSRSNIKITTPQDLEIAKVLYKKN